MEDVEKHVAAEVARGDVSGLSAVLRTAFSSGNPKVQKHK